MSADTLLSRLIAHPIFDGASAQKITGLTPTRTNGAIDALTEAGILFEFTGHSRNRVWASTDVLDELGELEERIGRRSRVPQRWQRA